MTTTLEQLSIGGILAILVLREVFGFLTRDSTSANRACLKQMAKQLHDLHQWHDVTDSEGVKIWYVRRSLEQSVEKLAGAIDTLAGVMRDLGEDVRATKHTVERIERAKRPAP